MLIRSVNCGGRKATASYAVILQAQADRGGYVTCSCSSSVEWSRKQYYHSCQEPQGRSTTRFLPLFTIVYSSRWVGRLMLMLIGWVFRSFSVVVGIRLWDFSRVSRVGMVMSG